MSEHEFIGKKFADKAFVWLFLVFIPIPVYTLLVFYDVAHNIRILSIIALICVSLWFFSRLPGYFPLLLSLLLMMIFDLAPHEILLSGFSSPVFLLALSVMGIGSVLVRSGLIRRLVLFLLQLLPEKSNYQSMAFFVTGFLFQGLVIEHQQKKTLWNDVFLPFESGLGQFLLRHHAHNSMKLVSAIFLTAAPVNFFIFGLLSEQEKTMFQPGLWMYSGLFAAGILLLANFLISLLLFSSTDKTLISKAEIKTQRETIGPMQTLEWILTWALLLLMLTLFSQSFHQVSVPLIFFAVLMFLLMISAENSVQWLKSLNWGFLFMLASALGIHASLQYLNIYQKIPNDFISIGTLMHEQFNVFVLLFALFIAVLRLFLSQRITVLFLALIVLPLAGQWGLNQWLLGFLILLLSPVQIINFKVNSYLNLGENSEMPEQLFEKKLYRFNLLIWLCTIAAIMLSQSFWKIQGIL